MTAGPSVTVIMPAHNAARFVASAVRSVLALTHTSFELIVVDDGSTDATAAQVLAIADERLRLIRLSANVGVSAARNLALREARASVIAFVEADDECAPERLATQLGFLEAHREVDVVGSAILAIDEEGRRLGRRAYPCRHEDIMHRLPLASPFALSSVAARKQVLVAAGGFAPAWEPVEDYDLWSRLALEGRRLANCPEVLVKYRLHAGAVKSRALRRQLRQTRAVKARYWTGRWDLRARARYAAEGLLLLAPPQLVWWAFVATAYRAAK